VSGRRVWAWAGAVVFILMAGSAAATAWGWVAGSFALVIGLGGLWVIAGLRRA